MSVALSIQAAVKAFQQFGETKLSLTKDTTGRRLLCAEEAAFRLELLWEGETVPSQVWEQATITQEGILLQNAFQEITVPFSRLRAEVHRKNYAYRLSAMDPAHYVRDSFDQILTALKTKSQWIPELLTEEERHFLPLCDCALFSEKSSPFLPLLAQLGVNTLPLQENEEALQALERLQELLALKQELPYGFSEDREFTFGIKNKRVSIGLKTHSLVRKNIRCLVKLRSCDDRILVLCGTTDRREIRNPTQCAVAGKGFRLFEIYAVEQKEWSEEILQEIVAHACLQDTPAAKRAITRRPKLCVGAVFLLSGFLWGGILWGLARSLSQFFPALPDVSGMAALCVGVYTLLRYYHYAASLKR